MINLKKTGLILKGCRLMHGYTVEQLAERIDVTIQAVYKWERGVNLPSIDNFILLANLYDCGIDALLYRGGNENV